MFVRAWLCWPFGPEQLAVGNLGPNRFAVGNYSGACSGSVLGQNIAANLCAWLGCLGTGRDEACSRELQRRLFRLGQNIVTGYPCSSNYLVRIVNSMRRFFARPDAVLLVSTGSSKPAPRVSMRFASMPLLVR